MGSAASVQGNAQTPPPLHDLPASLDLHTCKAIAGEWFDNDAFHQSSRNGLISKSTLVAISSSRLAGMTDVFLTHDWGKELNRDNHDRVRQVNKALKAKGLLTWFDDEKMHGNIMTQMTNGIDRAQCVVVFVTRRYIEKVGGTNEQDNCKLEFGYASRRKTAARMVPVVMEARMRDTATWSGEVGMVLGGNLYVDMSEEFTQEDYLAKVVESLYQSIVRIIGTPLRQHALYQLCELEKANLSPTAPPPDDVTSPSSSLSPAQ